MTVRQLWRLWALLVVAASLAWVSLREPVAPPDGLVRPRTPARLPDVPPVPLPADPARAMAPLADSPMWGPPAVRAAATAASAAAAPMPVWVLAGYYEVAGAPHVIVRDETGAHAPRQLRVGERMPDGGRIEAIETDRVLVRVGRRSAWQPITHGLPAPKP